MECLAAALLPGWMWFQLRLLRLLLQVTAVQVPPPGRLLLP